jgi:hypothetical protein
MCTYQKENGRPPCCTHDCEGCMWHEPDNEKKRIMKVIWDTLHEGLSIDTVADQDWVYEQIRHKIEGT